MSSEVQLTGVEHPMLTDESIIDIAAMQSWEVDDDALSNDVLELARAIEQAVRAQWAAEVERLKQWASTSDAVLAGVKAERDSALAEVKRLNDHLHSALQAVQRLEEELYGG